MVQVYVFNKEPGGWYIDLPGYIAQGGTKGALQMVAGADTFLDTLARGKHTVRVALSREYFQGADKLELVKTDEYMAEAGAYYVLRNYKGAEVNRQMWLCSVTLFVFGEYPPEIYIRREE